MGRTVSERELLTAAQVAARLAMKESTIRAWIMARRLTRVRVGRRAIRIPASEVERIIAEGSIPIRRHRRSRGAV
jgi:excisionase family DNA binding protein